MTMMVAPDLIDRRALALLALVDGFGRPVLGPVEVATPGVRVIGKPGGRIAVLEAPGFAAYCAAFIEPPASPAVRSRGLALDLVPADAALLPRRVTLRLPRDPDPAQRGDPRSVFQPVEVVLPASPRVRGDGNACILRASVRRAGDGFLVGNALVRARSEDGSVSALGVTDAAGEAALVFPALPVAFAGPGGSTAAGVAARAIVQVEPASAVFTAPDQVLAARRAAALRREGLLDPDGFPAPQAAEFAAGQPVQLGAGTQPAVALQWSEP